MTSKPLVESSVRGCSPTTRPIPGAGPVVLSLLCPRPAQRLAAGALAAVASFAVLGAALAPAWLQTAAVEAQAAGRAKGDSPLDGTTLLESTRASSPRAITIA